MSMRYMVLLVALAGCSSRPLDEPASKRCAWNFSTPVMKGIAEVNSSQCAVDEPSMSVAIKTPAAIMTIAPNWRGISIYEYDATGNIEQYCQQWRYDGELTVLTPAPSWSAHVHVECVTSPLVVDGDVAVNL